ncbi:MAG TPA: M48 family metalloprotease [Gemmatimonadaceae bacterium]|nr:M48 family metalloprotease [Gemmatimonadaceae bacterium]
MPSTNSLRPRRWTAVAALAVALAGCATNPVTGKQELSLVSEADEINMGRQAAQQVEQSIGFVQNAEMQNYVQRIGAELAARSERPNLPWTFRVVDDPTPNAFALPGGFIFVTRGMMTLMESEAELATVLGHEIGHVTARHSVQQMSRQQLAQLGLVLGAIIAPNTVGQLGNVAGQGLQLLFLKYGRDDERQADELGFRYALADGYDVREMADVFQALEREQQLTNQSPLPQWLSTHPYPEERIKAVQQRLAQLNRPLEGLKVDEPQYMQAINGLVYGENPRNGFFSGGVFMHPDLRFRVTFPNGWKAQNTAQAVIAVSPEQDAAIQLTLAQGNSPDQAAQQFLSQQGVQAGQAARESLNGNPAVLSYFQAQTEQGVIAGLATFVSYGGHTYQILSYAPQQRFGAYDALFRSVAASFSSLTDPRALNVQPDRLTIVRLPQAMTLAEFNQRYPSAVPLTELAIINQVDGGASTLPSGSLVKRVQGNAAAGN